MLELLNDPDFMETFTAIHFTWLLLAPCFLSFFGLILFGASSIFDNANIVVVTVFALLFSCFLYVKIFDVMDKAPFIEARMEQFKNGPVYDEEADRAEQEKLLQ